MPNPASTAPLPRPRTAFFKCSVCLAQRFSEVQRHISRLGKRLALAAYGLHVSHHTAFLARHLLFQPTVFLAVNPLPRVKRLKESLDCSLELALCFSASKTFVLPTFPMESPPHPSHPAKPDSFLLYSTPSAGRPWASTFMGVISACEPSVHSFLSVTFLELPHLEMTTISSLLFSLWLSSGT